MNPEFELKTDRSLSIFLLIGSALLFGYFIYESKFYKTFKHNVGEWILLSIFLSFFLIGCYIFFDRGTQVRIDNKGIFWNNKLFKKNKTETLFWANVQSCYLTDNTDKGVEGLNFVLTEKDTNKEFKLGLNGFDKKPEEIYETLKYYSKKFKFGFLGLESLE